jgi:hypothetical protein
MLPQSGPRRTLLERQAGCASNLDIPRSTTTKNRSSFGDVVLVMGPCLERVGPPTISRTRPAAWTRGITPACREAKCLSLDFREAVSPKGAVTSMNERACAFMHGGGREQGRESAKCRSGCMWHVTLPRIHYYHYRCLYNIYTCMSIYT